ncbi:unnamed protein product [Prunus armeniaca]
MAGYGGGELRALIFNGKNYEFWSMQMKTILKSHGVDAKKKEKEESSDAGEMTLTEVLMKDAKTLGLIQGAVSDAIFPLISHEDTSKGAWDILMQEFHDLDVIEVQEVVASLKSFELRLDRHSENKIERAFASLSVNPKLDKTTGNQSTKDQKNWKAKGNKWDNKSTYGPRNTCKHYGKLHLASVNLRASQSATTVTSLVILQETAIVRNQCDSSTMFYASNNSNTSVKGYEDNVTANVEIGTGQLVEVTGKGNLVVETKIARDTSRRLCWCLD